MGIFGTGKKKTEEIEVGSHDQHAPKHHDQEAGVIHDEQHNNKHEKNFFKTIFGKRVENHHGEGHDEHNNQSHKGHFFARILHRLELFLRICTLIFLVAGVVMLAVAQASTIKSSSGNSAVSTLRILDLASYKYILAAIIIGQTYIIIQIVVSLCRMVTGITRGFIMLYIDFLGDKILSYLLATGSAAAYGASINMEVNGSNSSYREGKTAASLVLIAFFFSAISSVISSHALPKHPCFL